jgi:hypothetical protein
MSKELLQNAVNNLKSEIKSENNKNIGNLSNQISINSLNKETKDIENQMLLSINSTNYLKNKEEKYVNIVEKINEKETNLIEKIKRNEDKYKENNNKLLNKEITILNNKIKNKFEKINNEQSVALSKFENISHKVQL